MWLTLGYYTYIKRRISWPYYKDLGTGIYKLKHHNYNFKKIDLN